MLSDVLNMRTIRVLRACAVALVVVGAAFLAVGCTGTASQGGIKPNAAAPAPAQPSATGTVTTAADVQLCGECSKKVMSPMVKGEPVVQAGTQVLKVDLVNGYYSPNRFTVKSGMPVQVVFTGTAKGCLAKPMFKALGKKTDLTATGTGTIDLGTLKPGTYKFTCAMGMNGGMITVQ